MKPFIKTDPLEMASYTGYTRNYVCGMKVNWDAERKVRERRRRRNADDPKHQLSDEQMELEIKKHMLD